MNELERLKQLQQQIANPTIEGVPQIDALEQMQLRMLGDMQLQGLAERTQESYVRAIRKLAEHYAKDPDQISDEELANTKQIALVTARLRRQANDQIASDLALNELYGLGYDFSDREQAYIAKVTKADVQRVAQTYLHHPTIVITTPEPQQQ